MESLPLLRFFPVYEQQPNWVYVCPWPPETARPFCPSLELIVVGTPLTQACWSLEVSTWHILCSSEYLGSKFAHLFGQNKSPSQKNSTVIFTHIMFVYMCSPWIGKGGRERETERVLCVQSLHSQSRNNFRWRRVRERQISHDITYLWHQRNELMFSYVSKFLRRQRVPVWVLALPPPSSVILGSSKSLSCQHLRSWYILKPEGALSFWFSGTGNFYIEQSKKVWPRVLKGRVKGVNSKLK